MLGDEALVLFVNKTLIVEDWCSWFLSFDLLLSELWVSWFINEEIWELSVEDEEDLEEWWWYDSLWLEISLEKWMFEENLELWISFFDSSEMFQSWELCRDGNDDEWIKWFFFEWWWNEIEGEEEKCGLFLECLWWWSILE